METVLSPFQFVGDTWTCGGLRVCERYSAASSTKIGPGKFVKIHMFDFGSFSTYLLGSPFYKGPQIQSFLKALFL